MQTVSNIFVTGNHPRIYTFSGNYEKKILFRPVCPGRKEFLKGAFLRV